MNTTLRLADRVREIHERTGIADPRELAAKLLDELVEHELHDVLAEVLPLYVRDVMRTTRGSVMGSSFAATSASARRSTATPVPQQQSSKVAAVRSWYDQLMSQAIDVSGSRGQWKALRDCTADDLRTAASYKRDVALRNVTMAEQYEKLAALVPHNGTLGKADPNAVSAIFQDHQ